MSKKLDSVLDKIKSTYKIESFKAKEVCKDEVMMLDSPGLNFVLGGGWKHGYIYYLQGPESGGKTTLSTYIASQIQKKYTGKNTILYVDFEYSLQPDHCEEMGLDVDENFILLRPKSGEDGFQMITDLVDTGEIGLVVIDSITTINSKAQVEDAFKATFGGGAAMLSNGLRGLNPHLYNNKCSLILVSQERQNVGVMYGPDFKGTGGSAPKFYSSWMSRITRTGDITDPVTKDLIGIEIRCRNTKNKLGIPKRDANLKVYFHSGINSDDEYMDYLTTLGIITRAGAYYSCEEWGMKVRGMEAVKDFLHERPELYEKVKIQVNNLIMGHTILDDNMMIDENGEVIEDAWSEYSNEDLDM